ncbi:1-acyl-sn-glycerol-3-phosphate acyltransferase [Pseudenhygromyxa sp. WMMC2535]|uniref:lysophospholipid acyltransferase family protein n=1 Tax=Pseudenhygromyxa sp. WMMC2535 TaxID=2712867 RepID=UPI001555E4C6|nr:lysophospholipid acyltransferase family protein [Pseudenhygromyxa sp. WMMC2535]NVB41362.1 1-acyl-sn-glycerol-3-phosphate acyltransferase [Pseudenhygromyxa sp. WMMC2535]
MRRRRLPPREPSEANKRKVDLATRAFMLPSRIILNRFARLSRSGVENLPDGPALVLSNHVSLFDPWFTITAARRTIHFMATAVAMQHSLIGPVLRNFGSVPKKKFVADVGAIRMIKKWADLGDLVASYPEGQRSWDGELLPLLPGVEALVRLLKIPVVPVRVLNADRVMPRWAEQRRHGTVKIEFGQAKSFARKTPPAEIRAWLEQALRIDQSDERNHFPVRGRRLAMGIENPIFRCPSCFAWDSLTPSEDHVRCGACRATWRVDTHNCLIAESGGARSMTIVEARAALRARNLEEDFIVDPARFAQTGEIARSEPAELLDIRGEQPRTIARGQLALDAERLRFIDPAGEDRLNLPLHALQNANVELRRQLAFRTKDEAHYEVVLPRQSPLEWAERVEHWRTASTRDAP